MPGPRQKLSVLEGKGKKHLSKAEKVQRAAQEVELEKPKKLRVPKWLPEEHKSAFRALAKELLEADIGTAQLDRDTVGRYVVAQHQYGVACKRAQAALERGDSEDSADWLRVQDTCFKQCRACANDMGMTITSRCRLVLPEGTKKPEENPFEQLMRERMRRA